jgi:3-oxoacyl-[acyl-carrier-protein] synthase-3
MPDHDPDYPAFTFEEILDANEDVPELEALMRWAMVLHNQYPWERARTELRGPGEISDDDFVVAFHPRNRDVLAFIERVRRSTAGGREQATVASQNGPVEAVPPVRPYPPVRVREAFGSSRSSRRWRSYAASMSAPTTT